MSRRTRTTTCTTGCAVRAGVRTVTNALNQVTTFNTYNAFGQPLTGYRQTQDPDNVHL